MVQVGMGEQHVVDGGGIEAKRFRVFFVQLATTLTEPAVDQNPLARTFDQMTGASDIAIGSMEG